MDIKVSYNIPEGIDLELDKYLEIMFSYIGFHLWASGTNIETRERDLAFSKKTDKLIEKKEPDKQPAQRS